MEPTIKKSRISQLFPRLGAIFEIAASNYPTDNYLEEVNLIVDELPNSRWYYQKYEQALRTLDDQSLKALSEKAVNHFGERRVEQEYQPFFDQLNDCFAYEFLLKRNCRNILILQENKISKAKSTDLIFQWKEQKMCCEVKTIGRSDYDLKSFKYEKLFDTSIYKSLQNGFLDKLREKLKIAQTQIASYGKSGLVFIIVSFDDFTLQYYGNYRTQILKVLKEFPNQHVFIKVGLGSRRCIDKSGLYK